ncbi:hypothetical protein VTI28DRAFT_9756 [Corynascus sepedonium]
MDDQFQDRGFDDSLPMNDQFQDQSFDGPYDDHSIQDTRDFDDNGSFDKGGAYDDSGAFDDNLNNSEPVIDNEPVPFDEEAPYDEDRYPEEFAPDQLSDGDSAEPPLDEPLVMEQEEDDNMDNLSGDDHPICKMSLLQRTRHQLRTNFLTVIPSITSISMRKLSMRKLSMRNL